MIAHRRTRAAASASVLLAFIGLWVGHTLEYLRVWGGAGLVGSLTNPVHAYMLPLAAALAVLSALFALRLWTMWQALNRRLEMAALGLRAVWRSRSVTAAHDIQRRSSSGAQLAAIWFPLAAAQIVLYVIQENIEAIVTGQSAPGLGAVSGIHWAAPFVHLYVALLLACGIRICQVLLNRRSTIVERAEALVRAVARRVRVALPEASIPTQRRARAPLDDLGRHVWRRPPPLLLDI